jgi:uncharacterized membrane protein YeiH
MRPGPTFFILIETLGILSFAFSAMIVAKRKELSTMGIFVAAVATALGGGTIRDMLLGPSALPFFWVVNPFYIVAIFVLSLAYARFDIVQALIARRDVLVKETAEGVAYASLAALGALKAYTILSASVGSGWMSAAQLLILCSFFGAMSVAFGGIIRDVLVNELSSALKPGTWGIEAAFLGSAVAVLMRMGGVEQPWALLGGFIATAALRSIVVVRNQARKAAKA